MMKICYLIFLCFLLASNTLPEKGSVSSTQASYDGNGLILTGNVILDHGLGKMTSEEASLQRQEGGKDFPFSLIQLKKNVCVLLKDNGQLRCNQADLDFTTLKGILLPQENGRVSYTDVLKKKKETEPLAMTLTSCGLEIQFKKHDTEAKKTEYDIDTVLAQGDVVVNYHTDFQLFADRALYQRQEEAKGTLTAYPKDASSHCRLLHHNDTVDADQITLNLTRSEAILLHPCGKLTHLPIPHADLSSLNFQAEHLVWNQNSGTLLLKNNIHLEEMHWGMITAQDQLTILCLEKEGKQQIQAIRTEGPATFCYMDATKQSHHISTFGPLVIDTQQLIATIDSPQTGTLILPEQQIYYEEGELALFADHVHLDYTSTEHALQPLALNVKGNIRFFSRNPQTPARYGLADRLTYSLTTRTLILSADPNKKVLLWDESQNMRLSAPEIHITRDPETKEQHIKGIGKVQFGFTLEEQAKMQKFFPQLQQ